MNITIVAGARPNFIKIAPVINSLTKKIEEGFNLNFRLIHTGQHYDKNMSDIFFSQLGIPAPHANLKAGGGSQAEQTGNIMVRFEKELILNKPDLVLLFGDVTSTLACSIVSKKFNIDIAHIEGGIRSNDLTMPEEINRIVTDSISDYFFTTSENANQNLIREGVKSDKIFFVGNTMIDTLLKNEKNFFPPNFWNETGLKKYNYFVLTLHRPSNVDDDIQLINLIKTIVQESKDKLIIFPVHPRTLKKINSVGIKFDNLFFVEPMSYLEFNYLVKFSLGVITDSGGITEEATVMNVPCITLRDSTERPETIEVGTNELVGSSHKNIPPYLQKILSGKWKKGQSPPLWDGKTGDRIVKKIIELYL